MTSTAEHAIKDEPDKMYSNFAPHNSGKAHIISDTKLTGPQIIDMRNADGQIVHVNIEDISQFLSYHEVFGKIGGDNLPPPTLPPPSTSTQNTSLTHTSQSNSMPMSTASGQLHTTNVSSPLVIPKIETMSSSPMLMSTDQTSHTNTNTITSVTTAGHGAGTSAADDAAAMPSPAVHTCEICGKVFAFKYQYIVHRRYHNERKPFICQVCGQAFTTSVELTHHGKVHDGVKMFTCNVCYNVFANEASLERHMKRHSTDKPFGCTVCQKTFARKEHLENHFRSHTGETPFR